MNIETPCDNEECEHCDGIKCDNLEHWIKCMSEIADLIRKTEE